MFGLVHTEDLATFVTELTTKYSGMDRFKKLLTAILTEFGGVDLMAYKRPDSPKTLWQEIGEIQKARYDLVHEGENAPDRMADLAISVATTLLNDVFSQVMQKLGLHLHDPMPFADAFSLLRRLDRQHPLDWTGRWCPNSSPKPAEKLLARCLRRF